MSRQTSWILLDPKRLFFPLLLALGIFLCSLCTFLLRTEPLPVQIFILEILAVGGLFVGLLRLYVRGTQTRILGRDLVERAAFDDNRVRLRNLTANVPGAVYQCALDADWTMEFISDYIETLSGYPASDFIRNRARSFASIIHPEDVDHVDKTVREAVDARMPYSIEYRIVRRDESIAWVLERGRAHYGDRHEDVLCLDGVILDVSERHLSRQRIEAQSDYIRKVQTLIPELIFVFSAIEERCIYVNDRVRALLGYEPDEFCRLHMLTLNEMVHTDDQGHVAATYLQCVSIKDGGFLELELRMRHADGSWVWFRQRITVFRRDCFGQAIETLNVLEDIGAQKQTLAELEQQRLTASYIAKMASLGEMAGGIAHEINNPLAIILGRAKQMEILLGRQPFDEVQLRRSLSSLIQTSDRITSIIRGLRSFARDGSQDPMVPSCLKQIVDESLSLCESRLYECRIEFEREDLVHASSLPVLARPVQLSQILLNLISNALDAVSEQPMRWVRLETFSNDSEIGFRVRDSGPGIPAPLREKIMEPFFTTKTSGKGTGLGLSISRTIAVSHGGDLRLDTEAPVTTFVLTLPRLRED